MEEEFNEIINAKIAPIDHLITIFKNHIINEYKKHYDNIKIGYIHYIDFEIPSGYISKYGITTCIQTIKDVLIKYNRIEVDYNVYKYKNNNINSLIEDRIIKENNFVTYRMYDDGSKVWSEYFVNGFIIPVVKDNYLSDESNVQVHNQVTNLDSIEIL